MLKSGALESDREFALFDHQGRFINGKHNPRVHLLRSSFNHRARTVAFQISGTDQVHVFNLDDQRAAIAAWLSGYFDARVEFKQDRQAGFPDDTQASGPTLISTATLETVASWFSGISTEEMRSRLRSNLEVSGVPAFWEDQLFAEVGYTVQFQVGAVQFEGVNPCQRCVVPARDPHSGKTYPQFQKIFIEKRQETLPSWVTPSRFNHFFRLAVNTQIPESETGKLLQVGDDVKILGVTES